MLERQYLKFNIKLHFFHYSCCIIRADYSIELSDFFCNSILNRIFLIIPAEYITCILKLNVKLNFGIVFILNGLHFSSTVNIIEHTEHVYIFPCTIFFQLILYFPTFLSINNIFRWHSTLLIMRAVRQIARNISFLNKRYF